MKKYLLILLATGMFYGCADKEYTGPTNEIKFTMNTPEGGSFHVTTSVIRDGEVEWTQYTENQSEFELIKDFALKPNDLIECKTRTATRYNHETQIRIYIDGELMRKRDKNCTGTTCGYTYSGG